MHYDIYSHYYQTYRVYILEHIHSMLRYDTFLLYIYLWCICVYNEVIFHAIYKILYLVFFFNNPYKRI